MEITHHTRDSLILEDRSWVARVFIIALAGAGILLTLSSMREYGVQAWYRLTHWMGTLMAVAGALVYWRLVFNLRLEISLVHETLHLSRLRGFQWESLHQFALSEVTDLRIERKTLGPRERFRLAIYAHGNWIPIQRSYSHDFGQVEQAGKALQTMLPAL